MQNKKILLVEIIEDEKSLLKVLSERFKLEGFEVLEAQTGERGLELALTDHPDLILLDIMLPQMDGLKMLESLHSDRWGKHAKIIMLTNMDNYAGIGHALAHGAHDYLLKSNWKIDDIVAKVKQRLEGQ